MARSHALLLALLVAGAVQALAGDCGGSTPVASAPPIASSACFLNPDGVGLFSSVCTPLNALTPWGPVNAGLVCAWLDGSSYTLEIKTACTDSGAGQYLGADGCWVFASSSANYAFVTQPDGTNNFVASTQCASGWWNAFPADNSVPVGGNDWISPSTPLTNLGLVPGQCPDTNVALFLATQLTFAPSVPGSCPQDVVDAQAGSYPGSSLGCPWSDCSLFWQQATITCTKCGGVTPAPVPETSPSPPDVPSPSPSPPDVPLPPPSPSPPPPPPSPSPSPSPSPPPPSPESPPPSPPSVFPSPSPPPPAACPTDQCAGGFETDPGNCFDDPNNTFELVSYNEALSLDGATFTVPPPSDNNNYGAAITTPTQFNVYSSVIYNNTVQSTQQVLTFDVYSCVPDGITDEGTIADVLFDTLIEADLVDANGNTTASLYTATFENTVDPNSLKCLWNKVSAPVGTQLPVGSPFKITLYITWYANKQPSLNMITVVDNFSLTCPNVSAGGLPPPPSPPPPSPPCSSWWTKNKKSKKWQKKKGKKSSKQGRKALSM